MWYRVAFGLRVVPCDVDDIALRTDLEGLATSAKMGNFPDAHTKVHPRRLLELPPLIKQLSNTQPSEMRRPLM